MLVRSVPFDDGALHHEQLGGAACAQASVLTATRRGLDLPCRSSDADLWFAEVPADLERAKALCGNCPIQTECLAGALHREEPWGVWGGQIFERGAVVHRKRPRGRPSKVDLARDRAYTAVRSA